MTTAGYTTAGETPTAIKPDHISALRASDLREIDQAMVALDQLREVRWIKLTRVGRSALDLGKRRRV